MVLCCATGGGNFYGHYQRTMVRQRCAIRAMHTRRQAIKGITQACGEEQGRTRCIADGKAKRDPRKVRGEHERDAQYC